MSTISTEWTRSENVASRLIPFRQRANRLTAIRTILIGAMTLLAILLAAMWLDLIWPLPMQVRWALTRIGPPLALFATAAVCWWQSRRTTEGNLALLIDRHARTGGEVLAGLQLEYAPPKSSGLTQGFARLASARAGERLGKVAPNAVFPADGAKRSGYSLFGFVAITAILSAIIPAVAWNQWQRFAFPARDVPPYTGVVIELEPSSATVRYGDDFSVVANLTKGQAERLQLVTQTPDGKEHSLPMLPQQQGRWQVILTRVTTPLDYYARSGASRSRMGRLEVQMTPEIVATKVRIKPPAYTKRANYEGAIPKEGIAGLAGTEVQFTATSNRPLREGNLVLTYRDGSTDRVTLPLAADDANAENSSAIVQGSLSLTKAGRFKLGVTDIGNIESLDGIEGTITITADGRPSVRILEPKPLSLATPDVSLPVVIAAEDDFGITELELFRSLNGSAATPMVCKVDGSPRQNAVVDLQLPQYGLQPGDEIQLFARTEDNDPAGAKGAESPVTTIRIISTAQFQEMMLQQEGVESLMAKYQAAERYLESLAEAIKEAEAAAEAAKAAEAKAAEANGDKTAAEQAKEAADKLQDKLEAAEKAAEEAAKNIEKLSQEPMPIDVDKALAEKLAEMARDAGEASKELGEMTEAREKAPTLSEEEQEQLKKLAEKIGQRREQLEKQAIEPLKNMQAAMPLIVDQQRFVELTKQQRDLAERVDSLKSSEAATDPKTQRRVAELEVEQQQIREQLDNLLADIEVHADALPDDPELEKLRQTSHDFVNALRDSAAFDEMSATQETLLDDDYPEASKHASTAADILESFLSKCNSMGGQACKSCEMAFNPSAGCPPLGNSISQMLAMMGMKPGASSGGNPGMSSGFGAGGGYSMRSPGPSNVGMYGSLPRPQQSASRGRSNKKSQGFATASSGSPQSTGQTGNAESREGAASGQAESGVPSQYRSQVSKYFQHLADELGEEQ